MKCIASAHWSAILNVDRVTALIHMLVKPRQCILAACSGCRTFNMHILRIRWPVDCLEQWKLLPEGKPGTGQTLVGCTDLVRQQASVSALMILKRVTVNLSLE